MNDPDAMARLRAAIAGEALPPPPPPPYLPVVDPLGHAGKGLGTTAVDTIIRADINWVQGWVAGLVFGLVIGLVALWVLFLMGVL
jgi:hypothetical protein